MNDGAVLSVGGRVAVSTDTFTWTRRSFPAATSARLPVHGTVNDWP